MDSGGEQESAKINQPVNVCLPGKECPESHTFIYRVGRGRGPGVMDSEGVWNLFSSVRGYASVWKIKQPR